MGKMGCFVHRILGGCEHYFPEKSFTGKNDWHLSAENWPCEADHLWSGWILRIVTRAVEGVDVLL